MAPQSRKEDWLESHIRRLQSNLYKSGQQKAKSKGRAANPKRRSKDVPIRILLLIWRRQNDIKHFTFTPVEAFILSGLHVRHEQHSSLVAVPHERGPRIRAGDSTAEWLPPERGADADIPRLLLPLRNARAHSEKRIASDRPIIHKEPSLVPKLLPNMDHDTVQLDNPNPNGVTVLGHVLARWVVFGLQADHHHSARNARPAAATEFRHWDVGSAQTEWRSQLWQCFLLGCYLKIGGRGQFQADRFEVRERHEGMMSN